MSKGSHSTHETVGSIFNQAFRNKPHYRVISDQACGGDQRIPLFYVAEKSRATEYCNVDLLVLKDNKIAVIVEIEESNVKPTQICGKFLTSALSSCYIHESHRNQPIGMSDSVTFLQIVDGSKLVKNKTAKPYQWQALEKSINEILPLKNGKIKRYKLLNTNELDELSSFVNQIK